MKLILSILFVSLLFTSVSFAAADVNGEAVPSGDSNCSFTQASVPEPCTLALLITGGIGVIARHTRRSR